MQGPVTTNTPYPTDTPAQTPLPTLQPTVTSTATLITATLPAITSTVIPTATSPVTETNITLGTPESAPPSEITTMAQAPAAPGLPAGMIIAHSTIAGPAGNWQVVVCVANLGTIKATGVVANASWPDEYRLLALRSRSGPVDYKNSLATARFGDMSPGTQVQVAFLLSPGDATSTIPAIQAQLSYKGGPPLAPDKTVRCSPDGLQAVAGNSSSVQRGVPVGTPIIDAPKAGQVLVAVITPPAASETFAEPVAEQLATASWLCLGIPLLLVFVVFTTLAYKIRKRTSRYQSASS